MAFVTNQELRLAEREELKVLAAEVAVELFHLERITTILDMPAMSGVRQQFLSIDARQDDHQRHLESLQTGGDTLCYWMLYWFDLDQSFARQFVIIKRGDYSLFNLNMRIVDMDVGSDIFQRDLGEINDPAVIISDISKWELRDELYYRIFFHARNGSWMQDLILRKSALAKCWLAATRVRGGNKLEVRFEFVDGGFAEQFGTPVWR